MTRKQRLSSFTIVTIATALYAVACSSSDPPDSSSGTGGKASSTTEPSGTGGSTAPSNTTKPTGAGGATSAAGGAVAQGGDNTNPTTDVGGAPAAGGAPASQTQFLPACGNTIAGTAVAKGVACTADDVQLCYKTCGPQSVGFKSETCTAGAYAEVSNSCLYPTVAATPTGDYSCYAVPATLPDAATCGITTAPKASTPCTAPACTLCSLNTAYLDSSGSSKTGYCVCVEKTDGTKAWSCASAAIWPCPGSAGC